MKVFSKPKAFVINEIIRSFVCFHLFSNAQYIMESNFQEIQTLMKFISINLFEIP